LAAANAAAVDAARRAATLADSPDHVAFQNAISKAGRAADLVHGMLLSPIMFTFANMVFQELMNPLVVALLLAMSLVLAPHPLQTQCVSLVRAHDVCASCSSLTF